MEKFASMACAGVSPSDSLMSAPFDGLVSGISIVRRLGAGAHFPTPA